MVSSSIDCLRWNNCLAVFLPSSPHNSMRVLVSLSMASQRKNGPTWYAVSLNTTNPCARLPLITACPMKPSDGSFELLANTEQDKLLSSLLPVYEDACVRCDTHAVILFTTSSYGVSIEPDTFFSQVHTFQTRISRSFPCLLLIHCLSMQGYATDARAPIRKQCSRGGQKEHGSHLDREREKTASRAPHGYCIGFMPGVQADALWFPISGYLRALPRAEGGCEFLREGGCYRKRYSHFLTSS